MQSADDELASRQHRHWQQTYQGHPAMYGMEPSAAGVYAARLFSDAGCSTVLDLGAGHGRDSAFLANQGFTTYALDVSAEGLAQLSEHAWHVGLTDRLHTVEHDVREPLPLPPASVDGVFAHMLLCMALSTDQIHRLVAEVERVLRPGGTFVYTVRHTGDAHYGTGTAHGDDIFEHGGFAVHFFDRALVESLAGGWHLADVHPFEEGELPRRLWRVTQRKREEARSVRPSGGER
jgi:SAM-dependent methyltransferase